MLDIENKLRIGIAVKDPLIAAALYRAITNKTNEIMDANGDTVGKRSFSDHLDLVIYSYGEYDQEYRNLKRKPIRNIAASSVIMKNMGVDVMVTPSIDVSSIHKSNPDLISSQVPLLVPIGNIKPITTDLLEGIRHYISAEQTPLLKADQEQYKKVMDIIDQWVEVIINKAENAKDRESDISPVQNGTIIHKDNSFASKAIIGSKKQSDIGLLALHGGLSPESSIDPLLHLAMMGNCPSILLHSAVTTPVPSQRLEQNFGIMLSVNDKDRKSPSDELKKVRDMLSSNNPDCILMLCNTAHFWHDRIVSEPDKEKTIHLIEEAVKQIPIGAKVLVLATTGTINAQLHQKALEKTGRSDVELIYPDKDNQEKVYDALFQKIMLGKRKEGGEELLEVINYSKEKHGDNLYVIGGCTEVGVGLKAANHKIADRLIDPVNTILKVAANRCAGAAQKRANQIVI